MYYTLKRARKVAEEIAEKYRSKAIGIIFHGALARGYFDKYADIDIIIIGRKKLAMLPSIPRNGKYKGFQIDYGTTTLKDLRKEKWSMSRRWSFGEAIVYYDPTGSIKKLIKEKARFNKGERRWLMIEGIVQSEWFCRGLPELWIHRGDIVNAHAMFGKGMQHFYEALFALNNALVPYEKWRLNYARKLPWLPRNFDKKIREIYTTRLLTEKELRRRSKSFMYLWKQLLSKIEKETGMTLKEMDKLV